MCSARLLLIDSNSAFLNTAATLLESKFQILGTFVDGAEALRHVVNLSPDVVLLEVALGDLNGFEILRRLRLLGSQAKVVFLSMHCHPEFVHAARELGAAGYICKARTATDLERALAEIAAGKHFFSEC